MKKSAKLKVELIYVPVDDGERLRRAYAMFLRPLIEEMINQHVESTSNVVPSKAIGETPTDKNPSHTKAGE